MIFNCFDLETTGVDTNTAEVVQAAIVSLAEGTSLDTATSHSQLFRARDVPEGATRVHRITDRDPKRFDFPVTVIPEDAPAFVDCVASMCGALLADDSVIVTFNGCSYDVPIVARYMARASGESQEAIEIRLNARHIDVFRLWMRARASALIAPLWFSVGDYGCRVPSLTSDMFAGSLAAAHGFWLGEGFDSAHDAAVDCLATLRVLDAMLREDFVDVERAIAWSNEPLPGDVDFAGKFKWGDGDRVVIPFGKHAGSRIEDIPRSYLQWMLTGADFHRSTRQVIVDFLAGRYPVRAA